MKVVVLGGAGDMGSRAVRDLARQPEVTELTIADLNLAAARKLASESGEKVKVVQVDANQPRTLVEAMRGHDVAAGAIGPFYRYEKVMVEAALEARVNYTSICDDYDAVESILPLDGRAGELGVKVLTGMGWTPGLSNVLARKGADQLDRVDEINIYWAGASADSTGFAVVLHTIHIFTGQVPSFTGGRQVRVAAGSGKERVEFIEPLGRVSMFHLGHPEPVTLPRYIPGVKTVTLKGGLTEEFLNSLAVAIARLRLTNTRRKKQVVGKIIKTILPALEKVGKPGVPISGIRVDIKGERAGQSQHLVYQAADHMNNLTGVPLAIGALMLGRGQIRRAGVFAPEAPGAVDPDAFIAALAERNINVHCTQGLK
ncbi:saccharopine dehydrogenase [Clostridiales bacterium PH28_bin88]|nr:saccharopine dehydrogenase [Clostridiales bacterium PH28_bin88]